MNIIRKDSPNFNERPEGTIIDTVILHYTGMQSAKAALDKMCSIEGKVSSHYCIDEIGNIYQLVNDKMRAWHAGVSYWAGKENLNNNSIGIEIVNPGHEFGYTEFADEQYKALLFLLGEIFKNNPIDKKLVIGHSDIAPDRKEDPGELFNWQLLAENGFSIWHGMDEYYLDNCRALLNENDTGHKIEELQWNFKKFGYKVDVTGVFDKQTKQVIAAFYRRFIPGRILVNENTRYPENISWDDKAAECLNILFNL